MLWTFSLSIPLSIDIRAASTFWLLWIMLQWTGVCKHHFEILLLIILGKYPEVGLLDHMVILFLVFWGTFILFSIAAVPFYIPPTVYQSSNFSTSWPTLVFCFFDSDYLNGCEVIPHCGFDLHFPDDWGCWASFHMFLGYLFIFCGEMSVEVLCYFLMLLFKVTFVVVVKL